MRCRSPLVLCSVVIANAIALVLLGKIPVEHPASNLYDELVSSQFGLLAVWLVFGAWKWPWRALSALPATAALVALEYQRYQGKGSEGASETFQELLAWEVLPAVVVAAGVFLARFVWPKIRLFKVNDLHESALPAAEAGISRRALVVLFVIVAAAIWGARPVHERFLQWTLDPFFEDSTSSLIELAFGVCQAALMVSTSWFLAWFALGTARPYARCLLLAFLVQLVDSLLEYILVPTFTDVLPVMWIGHILLGLPSYLAIRFCGFRLVRVARLSGNEARRVGDETVGDRPSWHSAQLNSREMPNKRPRPQFSLRSALVTLTLLCIGCAGIAAWMNRANAQRAAVAAIEAMDGDVTYADDLIILQFIDANRVTRVTHEGAMESFPRWFMRRWLPRDYVTDVTKVALTSITNAADLRCLAQLHGLRSLDLSGTEITDSAMSEIAVLVDLRELEIESCNELTDAGLANLQSLSRLERLALGDASVTDAGLAHMGTLTTLKELELGGTAITDAGLSNLKRLVALERLGLACTHVSDAGIHVVASFDRLRGLTLSSTNVTDVTLARLTRLSDLESLDLDETLVSDEGLSHLRSHPRLRNLSLNGSKVTDAGLAVLGTLSELRTLGLRRRSRSLRRRCSHAPGLVSRRQI